MARRRSPSPAIRHRRSPSGRRNSDNMNSSTPPIPLRRLSRRTDQPALPDRSSGSRHIVPHGGKDRETYKQPGSLSRNITGGAEPSRTKHASARGLGTRPGRYLHPDQQRRDRPG
jgi:hypothetical protein